MTAAIAIPAPSAREQARAQMFGAFVAELKRARLSYCLLSGFREEYASEDCDVDFMVLPEHAHRIPALLADVARHSKARLVQAIQHETGSWYFALARQVGCEVAYLHPDCTTDYRREGRLWLKAHEVLARQRQVSAGHVPSASDEFIYYLLKKVLKQDIEPGHVHRLRLLYAGAPEECCENLRRFWCPSTVAAVTSAMLRSDVNWMQRQIRVLLDELLASAPVEGFAGRWLQQAREYRRILSRMKHPTGASVVVYGADSQRRAELADALLENLRPAFRRTRVVDNATHFLLPKEWPAQVRSTLILRTTPSYRGSIVRHKDHEFQVDADEHDVVSATRDVLTWLERRTMRRLARV